MIQYFGDDDLRKLVGGRLWWQVRGLRGVQAEWIAMRQDWKRATAVEERLADGQSEKELLRRAKKVGHNKRHERKRSFAAPIRRSLDRRRSDKSARLHAAKEDEEHASTRKEEKAKRRDEEEELDEGKNEPSESFEELDRLKRVMYYIHGGGYYFGSLSTHRLMITRFARKFGGRAFAVNYRKAPQYPWPCAVQDVLAGYLYLIQPPPEARHKAIDPAQIVVAGDSAGGGLCLALLCILRDLNLPMPSGGVLLSPWCDMTHSFPSILQNTATDIIPTYGFVHKPSTLWPVPDEPLPPDAAHDGGNARTTDHVRHDHDGSASESGTQTPKKVANKAVKGSAAATLASYADQNEGDDKGNDKERHDSTSSSPPPSLSHLPQKEFTVMVQDKKGQEKPLKVTRQIQLYATNSQLFHPLCSPILQGSLGGLPPLYILAGDSEVLRDEIIYLAHRAAHPTLYPLKEDLLAANKRAQQNAENFNHKPTKVHLQVYDGQPHVLTLFSFTTSARYAYRAIASFVKHVTGAPTNVINPFPHLSNTGSGLSEAPSIPPVHETTVKANGDAKHEGGKQSMLDPIDTSVNAQGNGANDAEASMGSTNDSPVPMSATTMNSSTDKVTVVDGPADKKTAAARRRYNVTLGAENAYDGQVPLRRPTFVQEMIRERVDIRGRIRPLEEAKMLQGLQLPLEEIGTIKEGAVCRYLTGQTKWDERFKKEARRVAKRRRKNEERVQTMLQQAAAEGLLGDLPLQTGDPHAPSDGDQQDGWADLVRLGPLGLAGETPPPSAIAGRRDTGESVELLRQALHMRAERMQASTDSAAKASLGTHLPGLRDRSRVKYRGATGGHWKQSAAERQVEGRAKYGLKAWAGAMSFFGRRKRHTATVRRANNSTGRRPMRSDIQPDDGSWIDSAVQDDHTNDPAEVVSPPAAAAAAAKQTVS